VSLGPTEAVESGEAGVCVCVCVCVCVGEVDDRDGGCVAFVLDILFLWALCNTTPYIALGRAVSL
jgi:hypothetical protein